MSDKAPTPVPSTDVKTMLQRDLLGHLLFSVECAPDTDQEELWRISTEAAREGYRKQADALLTAAADLGTPVLDYPVKKLAVAIRKIITVPSRPAYNILDNVTE